MNKLKTLKDIVLIESPLNRKVGGAYKYGERDLIIRELMRRECKKEVIKWIKELRQSPDFFKGQNYESGEAQVQWIKHFFNITEGDIE